MSKCRLATLCSGLIILCVCFICAVLSDTLLADMSLTAFLVGSLGMAAGFGGVGLIGWSIVSCEANLPDFFN